MTRIVTFGESIIQLSPPRREPIETASSFGVRVDGAESNVAITADRLGVDATWISKLPDTPLGRKIAGELNRHGLDLDVVWTETGRVGTAYLEYGSRPRTPVAIQDRSNSAFTTVRADELVVGSLADADLFFGTGITPALSDDAGRTLGSLLVTAQERNIRTAFDLNYRDQLWSPNDARETLLKYFPVVDVLFTTAADARLVLDIDGPALDLVHHIASEWSFETVVVTLGEHGSIVWDDATITERDAIRTDTIDHAGTGDAFVGGFLAGRLAGDSIQSALDLGTAAAAFTRTVPGPIGPVDRVTLETIIRENPPT